MQIGIRLSGAVSAPVDYDAIVRFALKADKFGIESGWLSDHVIWPKPPHRCLEGWTVMTAVAARTEKLRLGFSMLNPSFRYPAVLAKMAATFDQISRGRLIFSLGTGYFSAEYHAYGVPFLQDRDDRAEYVQEVAPRVNSYGSAMAHRTLLVSSSSSKTALFRLLASPNLIHRFGSAVNRITRGEPFGRLAKVGLCTCPELNSR